ncbi:hypothetical protein [Novosphingobium sp. EMRT-2]|uniref:hypothetical protein n=1 Tax=Novosphingobium sp. EMRT-2 TaxID=2571749 RepID=UPI0010BE023A|nr:hypothetical protein [Novosphingobium sp. EMRT-2]QCI93676.1 hypothetical protein FA702_08980 [Novosphingobium sp. EMRT-2]
MRDPSAPGLSKEEGVALAIAVAAHAALILALTLSPPGKKLQPPPERMTVTFSDEIADKSTSPDPNAQAAPDVAPALGEPQPAQEALPQPEPQPAPQPQPQPKPQPEPKPQPQPKPVAPQPRPVPPKPVPRPVPPRPAPPHPAPPKPAPQARPAPARPQAAAPRAGDDRPRRRPDAPAGGSFVGSDFLKGVAGATTPGTAQTPPAATLGPEVRSSLASSISRQIKPHWTAPQGADADLLVTILAWDLNPDGSLAGRPRVVQQSGITDANRPQAQRHAEMAIRAVQLAAPFNLPAQYYNGWKRIAQFRFDRKLSQ